MKYPKHIWSQLKNISCEELISTLENDGFRLDTKVGSQRTYRRPDERKITIHYHPHKTYGPKLLKQLLSEIGWTIEDIKRLKLVK